MDLILVRYAEMGLKSTAVRRRFEKVLTGNILASLARNGIEAVVRSERGRIYDSTDRVPEALAPISRVFGVSSLSAAMETLADMESVRSLAVSYSREVIDRGSKFALRVRRTGSHPFTSMDVARDVGAAVLEANSDRQASVDLDSPDIELRIEIRNRRAFVFSEIIRGPGGLPMGSQGAVLAVVEEPRDAVAAWLMMKRGCKVMVAAKHDSYPVSVLARWDPELKVVEQELVPQLVRAHHPLAVVFGYRIGDIEKTKELALTLPAFYPVVGMSEEEIAKRFLEISA